MTSVKPFDGWASSSAPATPARAESPVPGYHVTTPWGRKPKDDTYWQTRGHHTGDDYGDADGSGRVRGKPVVAVLAGRAVYRGFDKVLGRIVLLFADNGETYWYCHLNSVSVPAGDATRGGRRVDVDEALGRVGMTGTGASMGPHLHFEKRSGHSSSWAGPDVRPSW